MKTSVTQQGLIKEIGRPTPGPREDRIKSERYGVDALPGVAVRQLQYVCGSRSDIQPRETVRANARLIAAAPELLAALRVVKAQLDQGIHAAWNPAVTAQVDAAIAKVIGE